MFYLRKLVPRMENERISDAGFKIIWYKYKVFNVKNDLHYLQLLPYLGCRLLKNIDFLNSYTLAVALSLLFVLH